MNHETEIDWSIIIDFPVPDDLQELMDKAEDADARGDISAYLFTADDIDTVAKNCYVEGLLSEHQWMQLSRRYKQW